MIDSKKLKGFRIPSSKHRRVTYKNLIEFFEENNLPTDMIISNYYHYKDLE